jgi:hypothetical protein
LLPGADHYWLVDSVSDTSQPLLTTSTAMRHADDDVQPCPGWLAAYVAAFKAHPTAPAFAGPTYLLRRPAALLPCAVHLSDVSFFWEAPAGWNRQQVRS